MEIVVRYYEKVEKVARVEVDAIDMVEAEQIAEQMMIDDKLSGHDIDFQYEMIEVEKEY